MTQNPKVIALTFDDGPNGRYTAEILTILKQKNIKATFFVVGHNAVQYPELTKRIVTDGHTIGVHSMNHVFHDYFLPNYFRRQMLPAQKAIYDITGHKARYVRMPWLIRAPWLSRQAKAHNMVIIRGIFSSYLETWQPAAKRIAAATLRKVKPGSIIIFHDGYDAKGGNRAQTVAAVKQVVEQLQKDGFQFVTVDKLLSVSKVYR